MSEAEKVSELHLEVKASLMNEDFEKIKNWQKEAFHKQMMGGFKETKEAEDGFRKAQKPWAKKLKEVLSTRRSLPPAGHPTRSPHFHSWQRHYPAGQQVALLRPLVPDVQSLLVVHTPSCCRLKNQASEPRGDGAPTQTPGC